MTFALACLPLLAAIELGTPFSDHAVLQRDRPVPVWGTADPGSTVTVSFAGQEKRAVADAKGAWRVALDPMPASKTGRDMVVGDKVLHDLLVGEVWLASGQSNMDCPIWGKDPRFRDANGALLLAMTRLPNVRYCKVARQWALEPLALKSDWRTMVSENVRAFPFSAIGFYFARELYLALDVPIGLVDLSWGATSIDAWTPRCGYADCDASLRETAAYKPVPKEKFVRLAWTNEWDWTAPIHQPNQQPTVIWNGMVDAWCPMAARGVIWYQGCANYGQARNYCARMHALYNGWSREFENPNLSFHFVQLAPFYFNWTNLVLAQAKFAAEEPHATMVVTADAGNFDDVHPNRKEIVAKRLAAQALRRDYGFDLPETDSPVLTGVAFDGAKAVLEFAHVKNWYVYSPDKSLTPAFELAGADGVWHDAKVANLKTHADGKGGTQPEPFVSGSTLVLTSDAVPRPTGVRYMGKKRTAGTMYNEMSLPLGPIAYPDPLPKIGQAMEK